MTKGLNIKQNAELALCMSEAKIRGQDSRLPQHAYDQLVQAKYRLYCQEVQRKKIQLDSQRWVSYLDRDHNPSIDNYRVDHQFLLKLAKMNLPKTRGNLVTDFTGWIYSLYQNEPDPLKLSQGKDGEKIVFNYKRMRPAENSSWEIIYVDKLDRNTKSKNISCLSVDGAVVRGKPDVVYRNKNDGEVVIVERKISNHRVPDDGWPNLRAQLWVYGQIDDWRFAPKITLVGEIWHVVSGEPKINSVLTWDMSDELFVDQNKELFDVYACAQ